MTDLEEYYEEFAQRNSLIVPFTYVPKKLQDKLEKSLGFQAFKLGKAIDKFKQSIKTEINKLWKKIQ